MKIILEEGFETCQPENQAGGPWEDSGVILSFHRLSSYVTDRGVLAFFNVFISYDQSKIDRPDNSKYLYDR